MMEHSRESLHLGNHEVGDSLSKPKHPGTTRVHIQNLNGASLVQGGTWEITCEHWKEMEVDIALTCEHKIDTSYYKNVERMNAVATEVLGMGAFRLVASSTPNSARHGDAKSGGTSAMLLGSPVGRYASKYKDPAGRWVAFTLRRHQLNNVTVISTYQVVDVNPREAGPNTNANQLYAYYISQGRTNPHNLRRHHANDLVDYVKQRQAEGDSILVAGDFNEVLGETPGGLTRLVSECGLTDVIAHQHQAMEFSTYQRGKKVLDYCLLDDDLLGAVSASGYEAFQANIISDHRGLFVDFDTDRLFGTSIQPLAPLPIRDLNSRNMHQIAPYFKHKHAYLGKKDWFENIALLKLDMQRDERNDDLAERLYGELAESCPDAGSRLKRYPTAPHSPEMVRMRNILRLLRLATSQFRTGIDLNDAIQETQKKLGSVGFAIPNSLHECVRALASHEKEFKALVKQEELTKKLRKQHQEKLADEYEAKGDKEAARIIRRIKRAEQTKKLYEKCRKARGLHHQGGLSYLLVPEDPLENPRTCNEWRRVDCPEEIVALLQERNREHFGQSKRCNLTSDPFDFTNEFTSASLRAEMILDGTFTEMWDELFLPLDEPRQS
jgi:hypothetical protein